MNENKSGAISRVPFAEAGYLQGLKSLYWTPSHVEFQKVSIGLFQFIKALRFFVETVIKPEAASSEEMGRMPSRDLYKLMGDFGFLASKCGPGDHLGIAKQLPGNVKPGDFDYFHEVVNLKIILTH